MQPVSSTNPIHPWLYYPFVIVGIVLILSPYQGSRWELWYGSEKRFQGQSPQRHGLTHLCHRVLLEPGQHDHDVYYLLQPVLYFITSENKYLFFGQLLICWSCHLLFSEGKAWRQDRDSSHFNHHPIKLNTIQLTLVNWPIAAIP